MLNVVSTIVIGVLLSLPAWASPFKSQPVLTADWPPFVNHAAADKGYASRIIELVFWEMGYESERKDLDYYFSYKLIKQSKALIAYPFFKTQNRAKDVLFSEPLMRVENGIYFNDAHHAFDAKSDLSKFSLGRVAGYSYGEAIEPLLASAQVFNSELQALNALADGKIDLLPISVEVADALIHKHLPHRIHEFKLLEQYRSFDPVHLIAANSQEGQDFIERFNRALRHLKSLGMVDQALTEKRQVLGSGYVRLVPSEGFPLVTGYEDSPDGQRRFFVIPQGSRATVLFWNDVFLQPHASEKIFTGMTEYSKVEIVDGPHAGRVFFVRNMHLEVE